MYSDRLYGVLSTQAIMTRHIFHLLHVPLPRNVASQLFFCLWLKGCGRWYNFQTRGLKNIETTTDKWEWDSKLDRSVFSFFRKCLELWDRAVFKIPAEVWVSLFAVGTTPIVLLLNRNLLTKVAGVFWNHRSGYEVSMSYGPVMKEDWDGLFMSFGSFFLT